MFTTTTGSTAFTVTNLAVRFIGVGPPDDPPPAAAGATIPAPKPFGPGPLRWTARRLDQAEELTR